MNPLSMNVSGVWTVAEAKARLSHILRRADEEGPQRIGVRRTYVVVPERLWEECSPPSALLGRWLVENMPRGYELELPDRGSARDVPFSDQTPPTRGPDEEM